MAVTAYAVFNASATGGGGTAWTFELTSLVADAAARDDVCCACLIPLGNSTQNLTMTDWQGAIPARAYSGGNVFPEGILYHQATSSSQVGDQTLRWRQGGSFAGDNLSTGQLVDDSFEERLVGSTTADTANHGLTVADIDSTFGLRVKMRNNSVSFGITYRLDEMKVRFGYTDRLDPLKTVTKGVHRGSCRGMA